MQINCLVFQGSPEALDKDVVEISPPTIYYRQVMHSVTERHGYLDFGVSESGYPCRTSELRTLIGIHGFWFAVFDDGFVQSLHTETGMTEPCVLPNPLWPQDRESHVELGCR